MKTRGVALVAALSTVLLGLAGCSLIPAPTPSQWLLRTDSVVVYFDWTDANGQLTGTAQETTAGDASATATGAATADYSANLSGDISNGKITLRLGGDLLGVTFTGRISPTTLTLQTASDSQPFITGMDFHPGSLKSYQTSSTALASAVSTARAKAQKNAQLAAYRTIIDQTLPGDVSTLQSALATLSADLSTMNSSTQAMQTDVSNSACIGDTAYNQEQTDYADVESQTSTVNSDANALNTAATQVQTDLSDLNGLPDSLNTKAVQTETSRANAGASSAQTTASSASGAASTALSEAGNYNWTEMGKSYCQ